MNAPDLDPLTKLYNALRKSERMKGVVVEFGPREMPPETSPARVIMVPVGGSLVAPDHAGNVADINNSVRFDCLAKDFPTLHELLRRLLCAVDDYVTSVGDYPADNTADGVADCIQWAGDGEIEYDTETDVARQGSFATLNLQLRISFETTALSTDGSTGTVDDVVITEA